MLVEGRRICGGVTAGTTAKITAQHGLCYQKLLKHAGYEQAKMYLDINCHAVQRYREIGSSFDCDFEEKTSYIYTTDHPKKLEQEERALLQLGYHPTLTDAKELPIPFPLPAYNLLPPPAENKRIKVPPFRLRQSTHPFFYLRSMTETAVTLHLPTKWKP